jgi:hypothetical protein
VSRAPDPLGLLAHQQRPTVTIGAANVSNALRGGNLHMGLNQRGEARFSLEAVALPVEPVDYTAPLEYHTGRRGGRAEFVGNITAARVQDGRIELNAYDATLLSEQAMGLFVTIGVAPDEITYVMARSAGMSDDQLVIPSLDELNAEVFEVIAPVRGVAVREPRTVAGVTILPAPGVFERLRQMGFEGATDDLSADAFALSLTTARLGFHAEQNGLGEIDTALDWLTTRLRHALPFLPDGSTQDFDRGARRATPRRGELVIVRGLGTGRRWLRSASSHAVDAVLQLNDEEAILRVLPSHPSAADRLALAACRRAASERDPLARIQALWEAVECLVVGTSVPAQWTKEDVRALKKQLPLDLPEPLIVRARAALDRVSQVPLMARLRELVDHDALPVSEAELDLLAELRRVRNDAVHGREAVPPPPDVLDHATAIVCRLLVERLGRAK